MTAVSSAGGYRYSSRTVHADKRSQEACWVLLSCWWLLLCCWARRLVAMPESIAAAVESKLNAAPTRKKSVKYPSREKIEHTTTRDTYCKKLRHPAQIPI